MAFRNPPIAGTYLIRAAIQSPNYVAGTTGWSVNRDGTSEFNAGTYRGSITAGTNPGQHWVVNASPTHVMEVYDSNNALVLDITSAGQINTFSDPAGQQSKIAAGFLEVIDGNDLGSISQQRASGTQGTQLVLQSQNSAGGYVGQLTVVSQGSGTGAQPATVIAGERTYVGSVMVSDGISTNNMVHIQGFSVSADASGHSTFNHGCSFTPKFAFFANGVGNSAAVTIWATSFTATQVTVNVFEAFTTPYTNNGFNCIGLFFG